MPIAASRAPLYSAQAQLLEKTTFCLVLSSDGSLADEAVLLLPNRRSYRTVIARAKIDGAVVRPDDITAGRSNPVDVYLCCPPKEVLGRAVVGL
jgi:hypothetical protein